MSHFLFYVAGPLAGAALGGLAYQLVRGEHHAERPEAVGSVDQDEAAEVSLSA